MRVVHWATFARESDQKRLPLGPNQIISSKFVFASVAVKKGQGSLHPAGITPTLQKQIA